MIRKDDARHPEEGRGPGDGAEIVRVSNAVEQKQQAASARPLVSPDRIQHGQQARLRQCDNAAVQDRAGHTVELLGSDQAIRFAHVGERRA
jgi:hypothetical protein